MSKPQSPPMEAQSWSIDMASPNLDAGSVRLAVVIPTYKRPAYLVRTLASVARQTPGVSFAAVVVENDAAGGEGAAVARRMYGAGEAHGLLVVEVHQGNCNAYNSGFAAAFAAFPALTHVAIIDDDEIAEPEWLARLLQAAMTGEADVVGGPVRQSFDDKRGARCFAAHPVFRSAHGSSGSVGLITSTGNCLIAAQVLRAMAPDWLDPRFNYLGGGDTDFFTRCRERGFRFSWAADAVVVETVPARRTERSWITARSLRNGLISALIQRKQNPGVAGRLKVLAKSLALLAVSPFRSLALWRETGSAYVGSYHMMIATGRLLSEFGYRIEQYRQPEKN
jgi:GT2 family glycosyltransferase